MIATFVKDTSAALDYTVDWRKWLYESDSIESVQWTVPDGLIQENTSNDSTKCTIWLSGGTAGSDYRVRCRITTALGRVDARSFLVRVVER